MKILFCIVFTLVFILLSNFSVLALQLTSTGVDTAYQAMVVAARGEAVEAGLQMLRAGGNAVDAAVAAAFVIGIVEPYASGLGGGGGMLIYQKEKEILGYVDYYVQAPVRVDTNFSSNRDRETARSICVPGTPAGLVSAVEKYGRFPLKKVIEPAIDIARNGFVVNEVFFNAVIEKLEMILKYPETSASYLNESLPYMVGDTLKLPHLALILEGIAEQGDSFFYQGDFTRKMVNVIREGGGLVTEDDFADYQPVFLVPVRTEFRDYQIYSAAPPQSGITLLQILNMVELMQGDYWLSFEKNADAIHWMCEIIKRADADRYAYLADPRFAGIPLQGLLDKNYAMKRFSDVQSDQSMPLQNVKISPGDPWLFQEDQPNPVLEHSDDTEGPHTTQISVIDREGNMVSLTQTLGFFFGSGVSVDGLLFNSGMTNFSNRGVNKIESQKRPRSTISPTLIMKNEKPFAVIGTPGGGTIFNTLAQVIIRLIDFKQSPIKAVDAPRFSTRVTSDKLTIERRFDAEVLENLENRGYQLQLTTPYDVYMGGVQLILVDQKNHYYIGVSDSRRQGVAKGF